MELNDYCSGVSNELTAWKAKFYDMMRKVEKLSSAEKEQMLPNIQDLNILLSEMEDRIQKLNNECPTEWSPIRKEVDDAHVDMRSKYEETMEFIGKHMPVSVPG
jgi:hypothetical protein